MTSHITNKKAKLDRGWTDLQYLRFQAVVIKEGGKLVYGDKYWRENRKPEDLLWSDLSVPVITKLVENVRNELQEDGMEERMQIDVEIIKWKLQPWLRKKHKQKAQRLEPTVSSAAGDKQSPAGQNPDPTLTGMGAGTYRAADRPTALPGSRSSQYYDPVADAVKENSGAAEHDPW